MEDDFLLYQINNGEVQRISTSNQQMETISNFFSGIAPDIDERAIFLNVQSVNKTSVVLNHQTQINKIQSKDSGNLIQVYTPQAFLYQNEKKLFHLPNNIKICDLKQKLKKEFQISDEKTIKIQVKGHDELNHFFNNEKRSFYKYIKPSLVYTIITSESAQISNDDYNYTNSAESIENKSDNLSNENDKQANVQATNDIKSIKIDTDQQKIEPSNSPKNQISEKVTNSPQNVNKTKKSQYSFEYQINNGDIKHFSIPEKRGKSVFDIFSPIFPEFNENQLIFAMITEGQSLFLLNSQSLIRDIIDNHSLLKIFTPVTFSYKNHEKLLPFKFSTTILELKQQLKKEFGIDDNKNILLSVQGHSELDEQFNIDKHRFIKSIQPNLFFDIILDEFRFIFIDEVNDRNDRIEKVIDTRMTAKRFVREYIYESQMQTASGYLFCLRFDESRYILPNAVLANFQGESNLNKDQLIEIQFVKQPINKIIISGIHYKYALDDVFPDNLHPTVEECKEIIFQNYFFYGKNVNPDDVYFFIETNLVAENSSTMHRHHRKPLELQISYLFNNHRDEYFYFPLEVTVEKVKEENGWSNMKNAQTGREIKKTLNFFASCYGESLNALKIIKLYLNVNGYSCSNLFLENVTFKEVKELIVKDSTLLEKLNSNNVNQFSNDAVMFFKSKEINDQTTVNLIKTSKEMRIQVILRPLYEISFELTNGDKFSESFYYGTRISEIVDFLYKKFKVPYMITVNSIPLKNESLIQHHHNRQPFLLRISRPSYYFIINDKRKIIQLQESITSLEAKYHIMIVLLKKISNRHLFRFKVNGKIIKDNEILPSFTNIEIDLSPLKFLYIFNLPYLQKMYFKLIQNEEEEEEEEENINKKGKFNKIDLSTTFLDVKKKVQNFAQNIKFDLKFYYNNQELNENTKISEIHQPNRANIIDVIYCKKKITLISNEDESIRNEIEVFLNEKISNYKTNFLNEKVRNIERVSFMTDEGEEIKNQTFADYEDQNEFYYEIESDKRFNLFNEEWSEFNGQFYLELTIKEVRMKIEEKLQKENIRLIVNNRCLINEVHLFEIKDFVSIEQNDKKIDSFFCEFENCKYFRSIIPKLKKTVYFTYSATVDDIQVVLEDILGKKEFTLISDNQIISDVDERLFTIGNQIFVRNVVLNSLDQIKPVLLITNLDGSMVVEIDLNLTVLQLIVFLIQEEKIAIGFEIKKRNVKVIYQGRIVSKLEKIGDFLDGSDENEGSAYNQSPIYIHYEKKVNNEN